MACWVWGAGGTFLNPDDTVITFDDPPARTGMKHFFRLGHYLSQEARYLDDEASQALFWRGDAAITIGGHWLLFQATDPLVQSRLGIARVPGVPFVGGYHLVIWRYSRRETAAMKLVEYLAGPQMPASLFPVYGLPPRRNVLEQAEFMQVPPVNQLKNYLEEGRSFPSARMWGSIEKKLVDMLPGIWDDVLASNDHSPGAPTLPIAYIFQFIKYTTTRVVT
jgi:multiple sugar transport system substrate-binding protein